MPLATGFEDLSPLAGKLPQEVVCPEFATGKMSTEAGGL